MKEILASLFDIDASDPSTGIKISLKQASRPAAAAPQPEIPLVAPATPAPAIYGVQIVNGRVVRESRHPDSAYSQWAPITGPATVEIGTKASGPKKQAEPPVPLSTLEYVVVDVETTGGGVNRGHRITEIAIVRVDARGKPTHEYATLVNPGRSIPYEISKLTNISQDMVRTAPRFEDIAQDVRALLTGRVFVAHNAGFDWGYIHGELVRTTGRPLLGRRLCTVRLA
ncbi:MAG TPA: 3'-5' exonuclease, partial [Hyphomicrobiaceae bacterium]